MRSDESVDPRRCLVHGLTRVQRFASPSHPDYTAPSISWWECPLCLKISIAERRADPAGAASEERVFFPDSTPQATPMLLTGECVACGENWLADGMREHPCGDPKVAVTKLMERVASLRARLAESETREKALTRMLEKATVRLGILRDRMEACDEERATEEEKRHGLSMVEVPGWIEEQRELLSRRPDPAGGTPA